MSSVWSAIEAIPELAAVGEDWRRWCGEEFEVFRKAFLDKTQRTARVYPCAGHCQTPHRLKRRGNGTLLALCDCAEEMNCDEFVVSEEEARVWRLDIETLGRAVARALGLSPEIEPAGIAGIWRMGVIRGTVIPAFFGIPTDRHGYHAAFAQLAARLRRRFLVVTPTSTAVGTQILEVADAQQAELLFLEGHFTLSESGVMTANEAAVELVNDLAGGSKGTMVTKTHGPRYLLRKGKGVWKLVFDGKEGEVKESRGMNLVAWLLFNPPHGGLHATELAKLALGQEVVQEASLGGDGDSTRRLIHEEAKKCMATLQDPSASEIEREEAQATLEQLAQTVKVTGYRSEGSAEKQVRAVRRAIERCIDGLRTALNRKKEPHTALRAFGEHLYQQLWIPSSRFSGNRSARTKTGTAGKFTYEPPAGVVWKE